MDSPKIKPPQPHLLGVLSDVHTEDERLSRALFFLRQQGVLHIVCAGDVVDGPGDAEQCCSLLIGAKAEVVRGNHDRWLLDGGMSGMLFDATPPESLSEASLAFLSALPATRELLCAHGKILLSHGVGDDDMCSLNPFDTGYALTSNTKLQELLRAGTYAMMIHGHTHQRAARCIGGMITLNPGALTKRRNDQPGFAILDCEAWSVCFYDLHDETIEAAETVVLGELVNEQ